MQQGLTCNNATMQQWNKAKLQRSNAIMSLAAMQQYDNAGNRR
jgi:hypothetical protein